MGTILSLHTMVLIMIVALATVACDDQQALEVPTPIPEETAEAIRARVRAIMSAHALTPTSEGTVTPKPGAKLCLLRGVPCRA